jgi:CHAD domain-containing protein
MAFSFEPDESVTAGIRRIGLEQLAGLRADLDDDRQPDVHEARKRTKMLRAILQLATHGLDPDLLQKESTRLRDLARSLGPVRDADVRLATAQNLIVLAAGEQSHAFSPLIRSLRKDASQSASHALSRPVLDAARVGIAQAEAAWGGLQSSHSGWRLIEPGLRTAWRDSQHGFVQFLDHPDVETIHDWRKSVKTLWYQLRVLRGMRPKRMAHWTDGFGALGELLGDDHDLAMLADFIRQNRTKTKAARLCLDLIARRRTDLQQVIPGIAGPLLFERPREFTSRMRRWWRNWRR